MTATLTGKVALVTGAAQGIGRATAIRLAKEGARVAVNGRVRDGRLQSVVKETGGIPAPADITELDQVQRMFDDVERQLGPVELLVCNAARMTMKPFLEQEPDEWWQQVNTNLGGHVNVISTALPGMRRLGGGRIVIIGSYWAICGWENATGYECSKSGLISLGRSLARELAPVGIYTSIVVPGVIDTPQLEVDAADAGVTLAEMHRIYAKGIPVGRIGRPDENAAAIAYLCGEGGPAYAGEMLQPNGGEIRCSM